MELSIRNDPNRPSGGHAVLEGTGLVGVTSLVLENVYSGLFLSDDGRWTKLPRSFTVEATSDDPATLHLGPEIVDHVPAELQLSLRSGDGRDLGRLFWIDVIPSRSPALPAPVVLSKARPPLPDENPAFEPASEPLRPPVSAEALAEPDSSALPPPAKRRGSLLGLAALALIVAAGAAGAFTILNRQAPALSVLPPPVPAPSLLPPPVPAPPVSDARRCADSFSEKVAATRGGGTDTDRVKLAEEAIAARCGSQAFAALDGADWEVSEPAAWYLARFYDPNETDPSIRSSALPHPDWAAAYYARWAARAPRQAAALKLLCSTDAVTLEENAQLKRACGL